MTEDISFEDRYKQSHIEREQYIDNILNSISNKKVVVAGPGTGKTYMFEKILKDKKNTLTLTFVNALVEDLSLCLCGISDVKTLHGFAKGFLSEVIGNTKLYPRMLEIIREDARVLLHKDVDFDNIFNNLDTQSEYLEFYNKRKEYYNNYYGYSDIIFSTVKYLENNKNMIPQYEQIVVDEFQDFNKSEVALIDLLSEKSSILVVGDDDQALYDFKSASPDYIRQKYDENNKEYVSFTLPFCSRSTRVIVGAVNDIVSSATKNGNFVNRIKKEYKYFDDKDKDKICDT